MRDQALSVTQEFKKGVQADSDGGSTSNLAGYSGDDTTGMTGLSSDNSLGGGKSKKDKTKFGYDHKS